MSFTSITVTCATGLSGGSKSCASAVPGDSITVQATVTYTPVSGAFQRIMGTSFNVTRSASSEIF